MTIAEALAAAARHGLARLDAQLLLLHVLGRPSSDRAWLLAHDTDDLPPHAGDDYARACERRAGGEPLAYVVGVKEFFGLPFVVSPAVLVPRPETETLVEWSLEVLRASTSAQPRVIDLGTGSGAVAIAVKKHHPQAQVQATDVSEPALAIARRNAGQLDAEIDFRNASWLEGAAGPFDLIVSNPPYVRADDPHLAALQHEPLGALAAGTDGLADLRRIVAAAPAQLAPGGWLLLEHGYDQAEAVRDLLRAAGLRHVGSRRDLAGIERCSGGQRLELG